ncbi:transposase family protein [Glycomyces tenuis]|uniref:transposase family protein n=1 Tax=Glycomyces tenuis TaxID=58116 RepID=UPI00040CA5A3|nr:transposase family protein [Glycomyces tenuis]
MIRGSIHDTAARRDEPPLIPRLLAERGLFALGDKGDDRLGAGLAATPIKGKNKPEWQKEYNRLHARLRGPGERMFAQLKSWGVFDEVRCDPHPVTRIAKAVQALNSYEHHSA